ncbi:MAG: LEA type 2 family protein [Halobacteriaceae archaeon]
MTVRSTLFGSRLRIAVVAIVGVAALVVGLYALGILGIPSVVAVQNAFGPVNQTATVIETDLVLRNPNPVGVRLGGVSVDYTVSMNDIPMANGTKAGVGIGTGRSTLAFRTLLDNERIPAWWASHVSNGEHTRLAVDATACSDTLGQCVHTQPVSRPIETDILGGFNSTETRAVEGPGPLVPDPVAYINRTSARWGAVSSSETPVRIAFRIYNPNAVPLAVTELEYNVSMNDVDVGEGRVEDPLVVPPKTARTLRTTVVIDNSRLDEWWVTHVRRNQVTDILIDFYARVDVGGTSVRLPLPQLSHEKTIETDFFGTKNGSDAGDGPTTTTTPSGTTTTTSDDGGLLGTTSILGGDTTTGTTTDGSTDTTTVATTTESSDSTTTTAEPTTTTEQTTTDDGGLLPRVSRPPA